RRRRVYMKTTTQSRGTRALIAATAALLALFAGGAAGQAPAAPPAASYVGEKVCIECHGQEADHFKDTTHSKIFRANPKNDREARVCEACHGPGSAHAKDTDNKSLIISFTKAWGTPIEVQNGQCLTCHQ